MDAFLDSSTSATPHRNGALLRTALIAIAGVAWSIPTHAAVFWSDDDPMMMSAEPVQPAPRPKKIKRPAVRLEKPVSENLKPVGPVVISISIDRQMLKVYDANGLFAVSPVSTGMKGHSTPMGAFSIIQKNKYHRSNIYSGAPMPYMQRVTWSGIAMHAGMLPGYPASHGCIRMPMAFATKMWGWTRMGARVVITPGEISPVDFAHPLLATRKPDPATTPTAAVDTKEMPKARADRPAPAAESRPAMSSASLELKPTLDMNESRSAIEAKREREQSQTADASGAITLQFGAATMSDAPATAKPGSKTIMITRRDVDADAARAVELAMADVKADGALPVEAKTTGSKAPEVNPLETKPPENVAPAAETTKPEPAKDDAAKAVTAPAPTTAPVVDAAPKRSGQIAVLVSRKDGKMYVRQNYAPLFETPVTIAASDRPLGTHVFTAHVDKNDARNVRWSVVSMPTPRVAVRNEEDDGRTRRRRSAGAIEMTSAPAPVPNSATEALDRLSIPADAMAQIAESLASGSSIIVSDLGISAGGETGQGTEFVVPLR
ncbi:L,D-transpeptidase family protein [Tardiphaga sp.]|uniref:L,D-transpeptidase family protein n=1 Tax=Tardiphaga sp. TaxID=1926292 RepID=UPI0026125FF9|nr:L,D-transpeptidase family protein [Tardiphaga sp.]MDB5617655.1 ErfK/YbiS/YcfS/YnhG [Tardiphaga sp.]